jgi:glycosyltransferase involved in cell wall biosynthesis
MRLYQEMGYKVYFIPLHNFLYQRKSTDELHRMGVECAYYPYESSLEQFLRRYGRHLDVVQVFRVGVAEEALELLRRYAPQAPVIFHNVDMHYLRMERQAAVENDPAMLEAAKDMKARELSLIEAVDCTIVLSEIEQDILKVETPDAEVVVFPYMTPVMGTDVGFAERRDVLFVGGYRHPPNVDSAIFLAKEIWPRVRAQLPDARLLLVGAHAPPAVKALAAEDIVMAGHVDDLRPCFDGSRVFAAAIRYGAGIKGKVATAMSYGVPVVATSIAAEGMYLVDGRDVRIADDPDQIARAIVEVYTDPAQWSRFSTNGLKFVEVNNSCEMGRRALTDIIRRAALRHARRAANSAIVRELLAASA